MFLKKSILLFVALRTLVLAYGQQNCTAVFTGKIVDESDRPVTGAIVLLMPQQIGQTSDSLGNFRFTNLCAGKYQVKIQYLGFQDEEFEIRVSGSVNRHIHIKEVARQLDEVVIQHHDDTHTEHVNNFVQLDERQLAELAGKSLGESLKAVSGVTSIQTGPGIFKPVIHGVHSQRILMLNHGIRQEGQQWGAEHAPEIDPFVASNIVVIKDASAIKYGADALGGVIVVNPAALPGAAGLGGTLNTIVQSNGRSGTISGMLEGGVRHHEGWGWRVQGTVKRTGDFKAPRYNLTNTGVREVNFSAATGLHRENSGFDLFFSHFQTELGILSGAYNKTLEDLLVAMESPEPQKTSDFSYKIAEPRQEVSHNLLKLNGHIKTRLGEWRMQYGFQNNNRREYDVRIGNLSKIPAIDLRLNTHTLEAEWETLHSEKKTLSVGLNGTYQQNDNIYGTQRMPFVPNFDNLSLGVFAVTKLLFNQWAVNLGARYDYRYFDVTGFNSVNNLYTASYHFNNVSATAGATVDLRKSETLALSVSAAWRPPHVSELYSSGKHQSVGSYENGLLITKSSQVIDIDEANVNAEQALKFVTTYKRSLQNLTIEVGPYANYIFNYIYLRPEGVSNGLRGPGPAFWYTQTDAMFLGADLSGTWEAHQHLKVTPKVSLLRASDERNHTYLTFIPSNRYELAIRYEIPTRSAVRNFYVESKTSYVAKQSRAPRVIGVRKFIEDPDFNPFADDQRTFDFIEPPDGYWLWNLAVGFSIKGQKLQYDFRLASENTLNQTYREYTNRFRYYADDMGRNITFSLKCIF